MRPHPAVFEPGHFASFNRGLECFEGIPNFLNFSGDSFVVPWRQSMGVQHDVGRTPAGIFDPCQGVEKGGVELTAGASGIDMKAIANVSQTDASGFARVLTFRSESDDSAVML
jgi:hypothetical protein